MIEFEFDGMYKRAVGSFRACLVDKGYVLTMQMVPMNEIKVGYLPVLLTFIIDPALVRTSYLYSMDRAVLSLWPIRTTSIRDSKFVGEIKLASCFRNRRRRVAELRVTVGNEKLKL